MAELFVTPFRETTIKEYDIMSFVPKEKDEGYATINFVDPSLSDVCNGVIMICSNYAYHDKVSKYNNILYTVYSDFYDTKRIAKLKVEIPDITDTGNIINPYIAGKLYEYARSTISRCINFLLYSVLYNIGAGMKNGIQHRVESSDPIITVYEISDSKKKISFKLEIDNRKNSAAFTISSEINKK